MTWSNTHFTLATRCSIEIKGLIHLHRLWLSIWFIFQCEFDQGIFFKVDMARIVRRLYGGIAAIFLPVDSNGISGRPCFPRRWVDIFIRAWYAISPRKCFPFLLMVLSETRNLRASWIITTFRARYRPSWCFSISLSTCNLNRVSRTCCVARYAQLNFPWLRTQKWQKTQNFVFLQTSPTHQHYFNLLIRIQYWWNQHKNSWNNNQLLTILCDKTLEKISE